MRHHHTIPMTNEALASTIMGLIYAEVKARADAVTLAKPAYHEIPPAHVVDAVRRGR